MAQKVIYNFAQQLLLTWSNKLPLTLTWNEQVWYEQIAERKYASQLKFSALPSYSTDWTLKLGVSASNEPVETLGLTS